MDYLITNWIALFALALSIISISISLHTHWKSIIKFKINTSSENYCFGFNWFDEYKIAVIHLLIENNSNTDVAISRIQLKINSKIYNATRCDLQDDYNKNGITLLDSTESNRGKALNLMSENILDNLRISSNGTTQGYAIFDVDQIIEKQELCNLIIFTPGKRFNADILIDPLPEHLSPIHPLTNSGKEQ